MKKILLIFTILLILPLCFANVDYTLNQSSKIYYDVRVNQTLVNAQYVNLSLYRPNALTPTLANVQMTAYATGQYYYNWTPNVTGSWLVKTIAVNNTQILAAQTDTLTVWEDISTETVELFNMIFDSFLTVSIGFLLAILAYYIKNNALFILSGAWFLGISVRTTFDLWSNGANAGNLSSFSFFVLLGVLLIFQGISSILTERRRAEQARINGDD
jgi:hypothetical protein